MMRNIFLTAVIVFIVSIVLHEFGHWFAARIIYGRKTKWSWFTVKYDGKREVDVSWTGILTGLLPYVINPILLPVYLIGCRGDIKEIWQNKKKKD